MNELKKTINGTLKNMALRSDRERRTRSGLGMAERNVLDEFPSHVASKTASAEKVLEQNEEHERQLALVKAWIKERCQYENIVALVERRLFDGEAYANLTKDSGVSAAALRSWVSRVLEYLQASSANSEEGRSKNGELI